MNDQISVAPETGDPQTSALVIQGFKSSDIKEIPDGFSISGKCLELLQGMAAKLQATPEEIFNRAMRLTPWPGLQWF
jgi:hypothetical protein